jgi:hypothetical protein
MWLLLLLLLLLLLCSQAAPLCCYSLLLVPASIVCGCTWCTLLCCRVLGCETQGVLKGPGAQEGGQHGYQGALGGACVHQTQYKASGS